MMSAVQPALVAANEDVDQVDRLVSGLQRLGFDVSAERPWICKDQDNRPCIPVFCMKGGDESQEKLMELIFGFYESVELSPAEMQPDTTLLVRARDELSGAPYRSFDRTVDRELEFEYALTFGGAETLVLMPVEIFDATPDMGRTIEQRYFGKLERLNDYIDTIKT